MNIALTVIKDKTLTVQQKVAGLARLGEAQAHPLRIRKEVQALRDAGIICDLGEGSAPYRPRYVIPDYQRFMQQGSDFLGLSAPGDIWEATAKLLMLYHHVPSITTFPVYLGNLDTLLEPYIKNEQEAAKAIELFLMHIDRTLNDSFCHADLGPAPSIAGRLILEISKKQQNAVPNLSLKYDRELCGNEFALLAADCALHTAKPSFANHSIYKADFEALGFDDYVIASCYNGLPVGGGSCTLVRMNLAKLAEKCQDSREFMDKALGEAVEYQLEYMDERVRFLMEESSFFDSSFLVREGLIQRDRFSAMFGIVGLAECVNSLMDSGLRFGKDAQADAFALEIIQKIDTLVKKHQNPLLKAAGGHYLLHAQVGIDSDSGVSPGCRIPIGEEPELLQHILQSAPFHAYFPSGIGDVFAFEPTSKNNPQQLVDIVNGAMDSGLRYFSAYSADSDVVRITGYLVKRSEIERLERGEASLQDTSALGRNAVNNLGVLDRRIH